MTTERLTFQKIKKFMDFIDNDLVLRILLSRPEKQRPAIAAKLYNESELSDDPITEQQARYIGNTYYWEDGKICRLTPEINARL